ncbi:MAG: helix-turn-helix transcriptional regulator [Muribaculaceae bacterium]|nr:helix-turn-helix transcriptional regulator [Muribaculaceae bacterium]
MTRNAFAIKAGIDPTNFSKMLAGKQTITNNTLKKISKAHGISFEWLLTGDGEMMLKPEAAPVVGTLTGDDAKVSGRDMTINPPCAYGKGDTATEIETLRRLIDKRDTQIDALIKQMEIKDKQIQQLIDKLTK